MKIIRLEKRFLYRLTRKKPEQALAETLSALPGDIVTLGGSLPEGLSLADAKDFVRRLTARGLRVVIDSRSFSAMDLLELRPWLIKPNEQEFRAMAGPCVLEEDGTLSIGKAAAVMNGLHGCGIENVMLSLGSRGALLCCSEGSYYAKGPELEAVSTIGAGDNFNAGFSCALVWQGISKHQLYTLDQQGWGRLIDVACQFAGEACRSTQNYISVAFGAKVRAIIQEDLHYVH